MANQYLFSGSQRILSVSRNAVLLASRNAVLRQAGYAVETTMRDQDALEIARSGRIDAVVLGDSLKRTELDELVRAIKQIRGDIPVIVLTLSGEPAPEGATDYMDSLDGPEVLLQKLREALHASGAQAA